MKLFSIKKNNKFYSFKKNITKYWKYVDAPFVQPVLTSNGTMGNASFACSGTASDSRFNCYNAFDGANTGAYEVWITQGTLPAQLIFYNPKPIKVSKLRIENPKYWQQNYASKNGAVYGSDSNGNWTLITNYTNSVIDHNSSWEINMSSNTAYYKYYRITITSANTDWWGFGEVHITATSQDVIEATPNDYDFTTQEDVYFASTQGV